MKEFINSNMIIIFKKIRKLRKALRKVVEAQQKILDELCSLSTTLEDALNQEIESSNSLILITYKDTLMTHMNYGNCWNSPLANLIKAKYVRVCIEKSFFFFSLRPSTPLKLKRLYEASPVVLHGQNLQHSPYSKPIKMDAFSNYPRPTSWKQILERYEYGAAFQSIEG